jgi:Response regulator containing CheY-like receiver, AAA-type ATPase, and DNA-binding domains
MAFTVLIVEDEDNARHNLSALLRQKDYDTLSVATLTEARQALIRQEADIVLLDWHLPDGTGLMLLDEMAQYPLRPPAIVITGYGDIEMAVEAMKHGALDFLTKPIKLDRLLSALEKASDMVELQRELALLRREQNQLPDMVPSQAPAMQEVLALAQRAADHAVSVLITGETGTGKEVLAHFIHRVGPRAQKPFVAVNCAALPEHLLESELFGHEAGAFTDARERKPGLMEQADKGVLFLDEISSMPLVMQAKLLRALEEGAIRRLGGTKMIPVDVQIIAASNRDLKKMIAAGEFREDLYFRLKVVDLNLPPLRERKEDIPALVGHFIREAGRRMGRPIEGITPRALDALLAYHWPGNIRELKHVIERAVLLCDDDQIDLAHLPHDILYP